MDITAGADVADLNVSILNTQNGGHFVEAGELNHTYRIYRSNYKLPPLPLKEANFTIAFPESVATELNASLSPYDLQFWGSGEDANGTLHFLSGSSGTFPLPVEAEGMLKNHL